MKIHGKNTINIKDTKTSQRITLPSLKANRIYYLLGSQACWRGPAVSIYHAFTLARRAGVRGHVYTIYSVE